MRDLADVIPSDPIDLSAAADDSIMLFVYAVIGAFEAGKPDQAIALMRASVEFVGRAPNRALTSLEPDAS
jgi:hypothetical protein